MPRSIFAQHFAVAFLDILGQREVLRTIPNQLATLEEQSLVIATLEQAISFTLLVRGTLFAALRPRECPRGLSEEDEAIWRDLIRRDMHIHGFADSLMVSVPLGARQDRITPVNGIHWMLSAMALVTVVVLRGGRALRGGIDVGPSAHVDGGEVYGAGLERAYYLESRLADYPRILVGDNLRKYLDDVRGVPCRTPQDKVATSTAGWCQEMIFQDSDGRYALDYLGEPFKKSHRDTYGPGMMAEMLSWVQCEHDRFVSASNQKLAKRYERLRSYIEGRRSGWEL